ncbi:MAG: serine acetyltransferase [Eubacteriaceae bacterium]|nr:serine acetyltransferase [Eubacteriaceae bacterium]MBR2780444.1 serine acetyltransferase [Eubacteriaceae bacterium]MCR4894722.1 serine acetyltransferase [Eubacteriales bacterium]
MDFDRINDTIKNTAKELYRMGSFDASEPVSGAGLRVKVPQFIEHMQTAMYPLIYTKKAIENGFVDDVIYENLNSAAVILKNICLKLIGDPLRVEEIVEGFIAAVPGVFALLAKDVQSAYDGDPAARSNEEIMLAYPAFEAISIYRLAHILYKMNVPVLPRMMTEHAHKITGIDIHPGATIGEHFFIDHGTGVVIGETTVIGDNVKLYQGVTLGAKSFEADEFGNPVKGIKRHPNIGNNVIIYANATILGGDTTIGDNCVIGGNVWITYSVESGRTVYYQGERNPSDGEQIVG